MRMRLILVLRCVVVPLLVFAAAAKLQLQVNDALYFGEFNVVAVGVALVEFTIAALLLLEGTTCFAWQSASGLFSLFAAINANSILVGQKSCGCLGDISLQLKWMLAGDLIIAAASVMAAVACYLNKNRATTAFSKVFKKSAKLSIVMVLSAMGLCALRYSAERLRLSSGPSLVSTSQPVKTISFDSVKKSGVIVIPLANPTAREISIVGVHVGCDSKLLSQLPVRIRSGGAVTVKLATALPDYAGESKMVSTFYVVGGAVLEQRVVVRVAHD